LGWDYICHICQLGSFILSAHFILSLVYTLAIYFIPVALFLEYYKQYISLECLEMSSQTIFPSSEPRYSRRGDRVNEEPSAKNAQGLFPPDACIFVGK
jgi:hypothetical protein